MVFKIKLSFRDPRNKPKLRRLGYITTLYRWINRALIWFTGLELVLNVILHQWFYNLNI